MMESPDEDLRGGHYIETGDMLGYRYHRDGDLAITLYVQETTDIRASLILAEEKWREIFQHSLEMHGDTISVTNGAGEIEVTADGHGGVRLSPLDSEDELFLSAKDVVEIKKHLRECETHLDYGI